jgi:hypothetical protein
MTTRTYTGSSFLLACMNTLKQCLFTLTLDQPCKPANRYWDLFGLAASRLVEGKLADIDRPDISLGPIGH